VIIAFLDHMFTELKDMLFMLTVESVKHTHQWENWGAAK